MNKSSERRKKLKEMLHTGGIIATPGAHDCISAKLIMDAGFDAVYVSGFGVTAVLLGKPDMGFVTLNELTTHIKNIGNTVEIPIIADCESGYGNAVNITRAIREYEMAGCCALHLEDQMVPKRYAPDEKPQVVPMEEHVQKIKAAIEAREDENLMIIGRTDALGRYGLKEAIRRAKAYSDTGCDAVFVHGITERNALAEVTKKVNAPHVFNYATLFEINSRYYPTLSDLQELGFKIAIFPADLLFSAAKRMKEALLELREKGSLFSWIKNMMPVAEFCGLLEIARYREMEDKYLPAQKPESR